MQSSPVDRAMQKARLRAWLVSMVLILAVTPQAAKPAEKNEAWEKRARAYLKSILYTPKQLEDEGRSLSG